MLLTRARHAARNPWHVALAVFLVFLTAFLAVRAVDEFRWSDWGFGDAQSMLSLRQWEEGGWFANYFLFIPQGYAKVIGLFDDPNLRQHAHGTCPGSSPRIGPRLWYTHYPAGYLIPYAAFFRLGLDGLAAARLLSVFFSIAALILMYAVFAKITSPRVSFLAVFFYGLTPGFLGYADALANQPIDDLLRFGFMLAVVMSTRAAEAGLRRRWMIAAWCMEFALSLSSFDSVFFIFLWIIGWDIIEGLGFRWKRYLLFSLAPLSAHGLQFLQNVWYLGFRDALIDIKDAFLLKNAADPNYNLGQGRLAVILGTIGILFNNLFQPGILVAALLVAYLVFTALLRGQEDDGLPTLRLLSVLFFCGLAFIVILPHAARMPYESRQMMPFAALLVSGVVWSSGSVLRDGLKGDRAGEPVYRKIVRPVYLFVVTGLIFVVTYRFVQLDRQPVYYIPDAETDLQYAGEIENNRRFDLMRFRQIREEVLFARELKKVPTQYEPVYFSVGGFSLFWDPKYVPGYPQIMPITEYYAGSRPVLCFDAAEALAKDLAYLARKSPFPFSPVFVASNPEDIERLRATLQKEGLLSGASPVKYDISGRHVLDLTDALRWGK